MVIYLLLINALSFLLMRADKLAAKKHAFRIPERFLLFCALIGGSLGASAAMILFRHKTNHLQFYVVVPLMLLVHAGILVWLYV